MYVVKSKAELAKAKQTINKGMNILQNKLLTAKNAYFMVQVFLEMEDILDTEITAWLLLTAPDDENDVCVDDKLISEASIHVGNLQDVITKIIATRKELLPEAMKIQQAMLNSHVLKIPTLGKKD